MNFQDLLAQYPRLVIAGAPRTGKTTFTRQVSDRDVVHTDDWMDWPWKQLPGLVALACAGLSSFVLEGVRAPDVLRNGGLECDCVLWLSTAKVPQTDAQLAMGVGVHTVLSQWAALHPDVPIVTEEQLDSTTLDHDDVPQTTRRYAVFTLDASRIERTPQGGIRCPARVSKAGVFRYQRGNRVLREYRPASELRKAATLASLKGCPIVVRHPAVNGGAVDTENALDLTVGHFEDPFFNEDTQAIEGVVVTNDGETIRAIENGELADISGAYDNGRDFTPGFTPAREPYDLVQNHYVFNHIALGPRGWGRQGQDVGLLTLDANDNQVAIESPSASEEPMAGPFTKTETPKPTAPAEGGAPPAPAPFGDKPKTADDAALTPEEVGALKSIAQMLPALTKLLNTGSPEAPAPAPAPMASDSKTADAKTADGKTADTKTADTDEKKTMDHNDVERIAQEGVEVRTEAIGVLGDKYNPKGKTTRDVRVDVIRTFDSKFSADGKSDESVSAVYDLALKAGVERNKNTAELGKTRRAGTRTMDEADPPPRKPIGHQAYDAWREPAPKS